jgi:sugar phosphate isomerase/epimerase
MLYAEELFMSRNLPAVSNRRQFLKHVGGVAAVGAAAGVLSRSAIHAEDAKSADAFRYAICNDAFCDWPLEKGFAVAAECGYQGIEISPYTLADNVTKISAAERAKIRQQAEKAGLKIVGLHSLLAKTHGFYLTDPDAAVRRATSEYFGELARFCADLGGNVMVLGSPTRRNLKHGVSLADGTKYAAEVLSDAAPVLEKAGVVIALEPLGPSETNILTSAGEAVELMHLVNSPQCRLHLDCKAMCEEPTPIPDLIRKFRGDFVHFHANDPNRLGPGFGKLDFVPILKTLKEVDYRGWVSVEPVMYAPGPDRLVRESIAYLRKCQPKG